MGKFNHICELMSVENYSQWWKQMTLTLHGEELWSHCSSSTDLSDLANLASTKPIIADGKAPTDVEKKVFLSWLAKDSQANALINCKISSIIGNLLDESQTAREQWESLAQRYSCKDLLFQYELWTRVCLEKLKDAEDASCYLGVFKDARCRFVEMGVTYIHEESIFDLLQGLPQGIKWEIFCEFSLNKLSNESLSSIGSSSTSPTSTFMFKDIVKALLEKANAIMGHHKLSGPGSEYASPAISHKGGPPKSIPLGFAAPIRLALANQEQKHTTRTTVTGQETAWRTALHPGLATGQKQRWHHQPSQPRIHPLPRLLVPPLPPIQFITENYHVPSFKKFWTQMRSLPWPPQILSQ